MERKNIPFQYGIHRSPSAASDGELSECINLEVHHGELTPSVMPQVAFTLGKGETLLFVHKTGNYKNYIIRKNVEGNGVIHTFLCWFPDKDKTKVTTIKEITPTSIHAVGNTLVVLAKDHMEYILFKSETYKPIGSKPPFCSISFGLESFGNVGVVSLGEFTIETQESDVPGLDRGFQSGIKSYIEEGKEPSQVSFLTALDEIETGGLEFSSTYVNAMTESIMPVINQTVSANRKYGKFMHPFYLRYAYRMYDGSHYMHSAPVFFPVNMKGPGCVAVNYKEEDEGYTCVFRTDMDILSLNYAIVGFYDENGNKVDSSLINDWEDIISGLDVFVSSPVYPYKQDGYVTGYWGTENIYGQALQSTMRVADPEDILAQIYRNKYYSDLYEKNSLAFTFEDNPDFSEQLKTAGQFYKISEFKDTKSLNPTASGIRIPLDIKEDTLTNLEQQEALEDDYDSHNAIIPSFAHVYNGRLNISGIRTKLFSGYPMESMVPYTYVPESTNHFWYIQTTLQLEGREVTVVSESNVQLYEKPAFIYYPNPKVKKFTLHRYNGTSGDPGFTTLTYDVATFKAETHKLLNASFYLSPTYGIGDKYTLTTSSMSPQPSGDPYISYPNKIYTSEVNNPFFFPLSGRNSIGTGEIIAITSNTKAISPGQFGEYPLIVFSTDGVWAMQVSEEGLYFGIHPISKDICTNPNVLQTDGPVLFVTDNGLHSIVGDTVQNISLHIKGKPESITLPTVSDSFTGMATTAADTDTFTRFISQAVFAYDYANSRVLAYNGSKDFAYVISMDSGMITKLVLLNNENPVVMESAIRAYPEVYMQSGTDIYTFVPDRDNTEVVTEGILVTRTMTFADPSAMKVVNGIRLHYHRTGEASRCRYAMYVSNDGYNWSQRTSLRGHSFKYFRFAFFTELADTDALQGISVMFDYRRTHKLR